MSVYYCLIFRPKIWYTHSARAIKKTIFVTFSNNRPSGSLSSKNYCVTWISVYLVNCPVLCFNGFTFFRDVSNGQVKHREIPPLKKSRGRHVLRKTDSNDPSLGFERVLVILLLKCFYHFQQRCK